MCLLTQITALHFLICNFFSYICSRIFWKYLNTLISYALTLSLLMSSFSWLSSKISIFHNVFKLIQSFDVNFKRWLVHAIVGWLIKAVVIIWRMIFFQLVSKPNLICYFAYNFNQNKFSRTSFSQPYKMIYFHLSFRVLHCSLFWLVQFND